MPSVALHPVSDISAVSFTARGAATTLDAVSDGVLAPTVPNTADDAFRSGLGGSFEVALAALVLPRWDQVTSVAVGYYARTGLLDTADVSLKANGAVKATGSMGANSGLQWRNFSYNGDLTEAERAALSVLVTKTGTGTGECEVDALYALVTYTIGLRTRGTTGVGA